MNNIWVRGPRGGHVYREEYMYTYIEESLDVLNLTPKWTDSIVDITVTVYKKFPKDYGDAYGLCYGCPEDVEIDLSMEDITFDFMLQTLAHELIHAKQCIEDRVMREMEAKRGELFLHETVKQRIANKKWGYGLRWGTRINRYN